MSIENDLKRLADAAEGILAYLQGTEVAKKRPGRPAKTATVDPAPQEPETAAPNPALPNPALPDAAAPATMAVVEAPAPVVAQPAATVTVIPTQLAQQAAQAAPTAADIQKAVSIKVGQGKRDGVLAIITGAGVDKASAVPEGKRLEVLNALNAL